MMVCLTLIDRKIMSLFASRTPLRALAGALALVCGAFVVV